MESGHEVENFKKKSVLAICAAGTDRSKYISDALNDRGYFATSAGVLKNHNYVTPEDITNVGTIVFSSVYEKSIFDKDQKLKSIINRDNIQIRVLNITESDKNRAHDSGNVERLKLEIAKQLDNVGLKDLNIQGN